MMPQANSPAATETASFGGMGTKKNVNTGKRGRASLPALPPPGKPATVAEAFREYQCHLRPADGDGEVVIFYFNLG